jgi:hypothetical protein
MKGPMYQVRGTRGCNEEEGKGISESGATTMIKRDSSYLALDVDSTERSGAELFKPRAGLAGQDGDVLLALFEQVLAIVVYDELGGIGVGLEAELLGDEP